MTGVVQQFPLEEEYKKPTGISPQDISQLREWLRTQPHLPADRITDIDLILAYHCSRRSSEVTKQLVDLHFTLRTLFTSFFKDRGFDLKVERALNTILMTSLPTCSEKGYAAFYTCCLDKDPKNFILADCIRAALMVLDLSQYEEGTWPGLLLIIDLEYVTLGHLAKLDLQSIQQCFYYLQEGLLVNLRGLHFINAPPFMDKLMMILRPFLKKAMPGFLNIHQVGAKTLDKFYPIEALPKGAAGENYKSLEDIKDKVLSKIRANKDYFAEENKKRVVEYLRPGRPRTISDIFGGVEGSFKKLNID